MRKIADAVGAGKTGLINGVVVGQRGLSREGPLLTNSHTNTHTKYLTYKHTY